MEGGGGADGRDVGHLIIIHVMGVLYDRGGYVGGAVIIEESSLLGCS